MTKDNIIVGQIVQDPENCIEEFWDGFELFG
jgi:hypothetical protein